MFQSEGPYGAFHAASRALNSGPIYFADEPNTHDPSVLRPLFVGGVAGSEHRVLRPLYPALPTVDSIFSDARDVRKSLKIANHTPVDGNISAVRDGTCFVVGLFNCTTFSLCDRVAAHELVESVGWRSQPEFPKQPSYQSALDESDGPFAAYVFHQRVVRRLEKTQGVSVFLRPACFEVVTFAPIVTLEVEVSGLSSPSGSVEETGSQGEVESEVDISTAATVAAAEPVVGTQQSEPPPATTTTSTTPSPSSPTSTKQSVELACLGLADKFNGSVAISAVDLVYPPSSSSSPLPVEAIGYRTFLWARARTAFFVSFPGITITTQHDLLARFRIRIDGEEVPHHLVSFENGLLLVDARLDGNEVVKAVVVELVVR